MYFQRFVLLGTGTEAVIGGEAARAPSCVFERSQSEPLDLLIATGMRAGRCSTLGPRNLGRDLCELRRLGIDYAILVSDWG
jgi:hypothetical protein